MKIALINTEKGYRGGERQTLYLAKGFIKKGISVDVFVPTKSLLFDKLKENEINVVAFKNRLNLLIYFFKNGKKYDWIIPFTSKAHDVAVFYKLFSKSKVAYTRRVNFKPSKFSVKFKYNRSDLIIAISNAVKSTLEDAGVKNVVVIPSFVVSKKLNPERAKKLREGLHSKKIIGVISAFTPEKNPFILLKICSELLKFRDDFIFFHFGDGTLKKSFEEKLRDEKLEKYYKLFGNVLNVEDFYSIFDVFLMSSKSEGLGSSVLDAFLYGVPVISSDSGGLREIVEGRGLLCKYDDVNCFVRGIKRLFDEKGLRDKFIKDGALFVRKNFSEDVVIQKFLKVLS